MKISISMIEKLLSLLLFIIEYIRKQQEKEDEKESAEMQRNIELAQLAREAHPDMDDDKLIEYYHSSINVNEALKSV